MFRELIAAAIVTAMVTVASAATPKPGVDTEKIKATLSARFPKIQIVDVRPAPMPELYEVFTGRAIYYTDKAGDYLFDGSLIDARTQEDLTSARVDDRNRIDFSTLPFDRSIKIVKGNGARQLAVFTDPDCPYCRKFEEELKSITDVTIHVFLFPLKIHPNAAQRSKEIWCSGDRAKAWTEYLLEKKEPGVAACDGDPIAETLELGKTLNISGTPTVFLGDGQRKTGGMDAQDLQARLAEIAAEEGSCKRPNESSFKKQQGCS